MLSGGQRRRVDVAIGVIGRPDILFLDEPTTGLDPEARRRAWTGVQNLTATGTTVVLTTHYIEEADQLADRVIVLSGGRIIADTTPHELRNRGGPVHHPLPAERPGAGGRPAGRARPAPRRRQPRPGHPQPGRHRPLRDLVTWADRHHLNLAGLEVGPPSLEEAYLAATGEPLHRT